MRAVLDANVLLSGALATPGPIAEITSAWADLAFDLVISAPLLDEVLRNINSAYFSDRLTAQSRQDHIQKIREVSAMVTLPPVIPRIATHPEDDLVLATVVAGAVDYLVTGDRQLLALGYHQGIPIVSPVEFVDLLKLQP